MLADSLPQVPAGRGGIYPRALDLFCVNWQVAGGMTVGSASSLSVVTTRSG